MVAPSVICKIEDLRIILNDYIDVIKNIYVKI